MFLLPLLPLLAVAGSGGSCPAGDASSLLAFKHALSDPNGNLVSWSAAAFNCCFWSHVLCNAAGVASLRLAGLNLSSSHNDAFAPLAGLANLVSLDLSNNDFRFLPIPAGIFHHLPHLTHLNLSMSGFNGRVEDASFLANLPNLEELYLDGVDLGTAFSWKSCRALSSWLPKLRAVSLNYCSLVNCSLETLLNNLTSITHLGLEGNDFSSSPLPAFLSDFPSLSVLRLADCNLVGEFPAGIFQLKRLRILDVSYNFGLYGKLLEFPKGSSLEELVLSYTNFAGGLPASIGNLAHLAKLNFSNAGDFSNAGFSGELPAEIGKMVGLIHLDLSNNNFIGRLPASIGNLAHLAKLDLSNAGFSGELPAEIGKMVGLIHLDLSKNNFVGRFPSLVQLKRLVHLDLSSKGFQGNCSLVGEFPAAIFQLRRLRILDVSFNPGLSGKLLEFPKGRALEELVLSHTNLTGGLPASVGNLAQLAKLDLSNTGLSGELPEDIGKMVRLTNLDLSNNNFVGGIPSLVKLKRLVSLDLSSNRFEGFIYGVADSLPRLEFLNLGNNSISGHIPKSIFSLPSLQKLELYMNKFSGKLPEYFDVTGNDSLLTAIDLSNNRIQGEFPRSMFQLSHLEDLKLSSNNFSGTVQLDLFGDMPYLSTLELSHSGFSVHIGNDSHSNFPQFYDILKLSSCNLTRIPDFLQNQTWLSDLDLSENGISGDIPNWIWKLSLLSSLNLSSNRLTGLLHDLPSTFLLILDLHSNQLQGAIPQRSFRALFLDLSGNRFHSTLPGDIGKDLWGPSIFLMSRNNLIGSIPSAICKVHLIDLDLSENNLNGSIPSCLPQEMIHLEVLSLRENSISGVIPDAFSKGCSLKTLDLYGNKIVGRIPTSLKNCKQLEVLNLGNNRIEGTFPSWLGEMPHLHILVLRSNRLRGRVDPFLGGFQQLQIMDLSSNSFSGSLCSLCFNSWKSMIARESKPSHDQVIEVGISFNGTIASYYRDTLTLTIKGSELKLQKILTIFFSIDLSNNNFEGFIPETIGNLSLLNHLNLSHNALSNTIPRSIGHLYQLESLDLSWNKLAGKIPHEIVQLTFLSKLNLSSNQLAGEIPQGGQLNTFSASSYQDNAGLCGPPLSNSCEHHPSEYTTSSKSHRLTDWKWIAAEIGFVFGLGVIWLPLVFCRRWWIHYFTYIDSFLCRIPFLDRLLLS